MNKEIDLDEFAKNDDVVPIFTLENDHHYIQLLRSKKKYYLHYEERVFGPFNDAIDAAKKLAEFLMDLSIKSFNNYTLFHNALEEWED
jgi:hypothetical protein